jgi:dTDP-4-amino-4,6-dideoxygalactose transaminase
LAAHSDVERSNYQYVVVEVDSDRAIHRDVLLELLHAENILARRYFYPGVHRMEPYRTTQPLVGRRLPRTERLAERVLVLPTGTAVDADAIGRICDVIRFCVARGREISARMPRERLVVARDLR